MYLDKRQMKLVINQRVMWPTQLQWQRREAGVPPNVRIQKKIEQPQYRQKGTALYSSCSSLLCAAKVPSRWAQRSHCHTSWPWWTRSTGRRQVWGQWGESPPSCNPASPGTAECVPQSLAEVEEAEDLKSIPHLSWPDVWADRGCDNSGNN